MIIQLSQFHIQTLEDGWSEKAAPRRKNNIILVTKAVKCHSMSRSVNHIIKSKRKD